MQSHLWTVLGMVAGTCTTACFVPQVWKLWREGDAAAISARMYIVLMTAFALWMAHGLMIGSAPIVIFNALNLLLSSAILALKLRGASAARAG
jgi:MtN3 and saliva related transmembrane protein